MTCTTPVLRTATGPAGFEVLQEPCGGRLTVAVGVADGQVAVQVTCARCATPEAPWLPTLQSDPHWVLGMALTDWLDGHGQDFEHTPF